MTEGKPIRFAILGLGHIGTRHADMVAAHPGAELVAIVDKNSSLEPKAINYNAPFFTSLNDFISSGISCDIICIATPNGLHAAQAIDSMNAGMHVVIEKPMALTTGECDEILACAQTNNKHVLCVMQNRYSPAMQWLKTMILEERLGAIYMVDVHCYWNRDERYYTGNTWHGTAALDGGTLFTQFSHYIDLLYWLFGDVQDISARFANNNHQGMIEFEDSASIGFRFLNGGMGALSYSTSAWDRNMESTMVIIAEKGSVKIGGQYMDKLEYCHIKDYELKESISSPVEQVAGYTAAKANHHFVIQNAVDVLKGKSEITTNALEGKKVVDIIERIYALKN